MVGIGGRGSFVEIWRRTGIPPASVTPASTRGNDAEWSGSPDPRRRTQVLTEASTRRVVDAIMPSAARTGC